ncbi:hypothetical protein [Streptomyces sp. NPDC046870]|uniref:exo-rhamnogalacturonan lyase family protein n=1 Tax=Streptomyces sp. NPDC046870 TaxID=3155135 RepID=UPI0034532657
MDHFREDVGKVREVDVTHLGTWAGLGTRHGVRHYAGTSTECRYRNARVPPGRPRSGGAPLHGRRRSRPQRDAGRGPAHEYPYSDPARRSPHDRPRTSSRTLDPWNGTTTASSACGPCPPRRPPCTRHWSGPRTTPAGGRRYGR